MKCQCNTKSIDHSAGLCEADTLLSTYIRDGVKLRLCWNCVLSSDVEAFTPEEYAETAALYAEAFPEVEG